MSEHDFAPDASGSVDAAELRVLRAIVAGTAQARGDGFFRDLVRNLSIATGVPNAFVAEFAGGNTRVRSLAFWSDGEFLPTQEWDLAGTPCEVVLDGSVCHYPRGVEALFPNEPGVESYLGAPLRDDDGRVLGHLAVFDTREMPAQTRLSFTFEIFAARAATELNRLRMLEQLRLNEARYRDLFDEAPIAYVHEDMQSRFISANRTALSILGVRPEEVRGMVGMSLVPDTPQAQKRVQDAFASVNRGTDTSGVVLELRRKDDGRPLWIQWWSRPDPSGTSTRTMFLDITDKVLMEQEQARLQAQNLYLREELKAVHNFEEIVGRSPALGAVLDAVRRVAPTDATVLIRGETGTGKELIARAIHSASSRRDRPLIKVNCAALPTGLVESELFGHEKGAFTGAINKRLGRFELADGGTIFLDEIGEMPLDVQAKLLRVLQEREFDRIGGKNPIKVDVRVIAASNRDLLQAVAEKTFREDLYYRLNVFPVTTPPLRERTGDIALLARFLVGRFAPRIGKRIERIDETALQRLASYRWPGNVRELENVIERAVILSDGPVLVIDADMLPGAEAVAPAAAPVAAPAHAAGPGADASLDEVARQHIVSVLEQTRWVIEGPNGAAKILDMHASTLRYRMKKLGISADRRQIR
ncbi:MAG: sigma 54-interacting transcriptional regulator [Gammaproteobacteria bacterium]